jgi:hypothetical protein
VITHRPDAVQARARDGLARGAHVAEFGEDGTLTSLTVEEDLAITRDLVNEEGNCLGCWLPYDSTISHGHPVCRSKVTISGDGHE